jgi:hypothetical protein
LLGRAAARLNTTSKSTIFWMVFCQRDNRRLRVGCLGDLQQ